MTPKEAAHKTMDEVGGALIAIALVLCAVFIPTAFITGLQGSFYRQFAITIAAATVISAFVSLTLSPALAALLLKPHDARTETHAACIAWVHRCGGFSPASTGCSSELSLGYGRLVAPAGARRRGRAGGVRRADLRRLRPAWRRRRPA